MKNVLLNNLKTLSPRADWLSIIVDTPHLDRDDNYNLIDTIMQKVGFHEYKTGTMLRYRSNYHGIEVFFSYKRGSSVPCIKIEFQGTFFADSTENCHRKMKIFIKFMRENFGITAPMKFTRVDIAIDIFDILPTEIFPDITDPRYTYVNNMSRTKQPSCEKYYKNPKDNSILTGIFIESSRFEISVYERLINLARLRSKDNKIFYNSYYREQYEGAKNVSRIELRMFKELCDYFTEAYFHPESEDSLQEILIKALAHFSRYHGFKDDETGERIPHIDELFCRNEHESIKKLRVRLNKSNIHNQNLEELLFSRPAVSIEKTANQMAKCFVLSKDKSENVIKQLFTLMIEKLPDVASKIEEDISRYRRTEEMFANTCKESRKIVKKAIKLQEKLHGKRYLTHTEEKMIEDFIKSDSFVKELMSTDNPYKLSIYEMLVQEGKIL